MVERLIHRSRKHQLQPRSQCLCAGTGVVPGSRKLVAESTAMLSSLGFCSRIGRTSFREIFS
jgi:hypothetical protein